MRGNAVLIAAKEQVVKIVEQLKSVNEHACAYDMLTHQEMTNISELIKVLNTAVKRIDDMTGCDEMTPTGAKPVNVPVANGAPNEPKSE